MKRLLMTLLAGVLLAGGAFAQDAAAPDVLGEWELTTNSPVGETTNTVEFRKDNDALKAARDKVKQDEASIRELTNGRGRADGGREGRGGRRGGR